MVLNKCDLDGSPPIDDDAEAVSVSALTGVGIEALEQRLERAITGGYVPTANAALVTNPRHSAALDRAQGSLRQALAALNAGLPEDLAVVDLRSAADALGEITGQTVTEDLLDTIFRNFCIGK